MPYLSFYSQILNTWDSSCLFSIYSISLTLSSIPHSFRPHLQYQGGSDGLSQSVFLCYHDWLRDRRCVLQWSNQRKLRNFVQCLWGRDRTSFFPECEQAIHWATSSTHKAPNEIFPSIWIKMSLWTNKRRWNQDSQNRAWSKNPYWVHTDCWLCSR